MAFEDQPPCAFKFCSGTSLSAASDTADLRNAWKPYRPGSNFRDIRILEGVEETIGAETGTLDEGRRKRGAEEGALITLRRERNDETGHKGEEVTEGI